MWSHEDLGGILTPPLSLDVDNGAFHVMGTAPGGTIYDKWWNGGWSNWGPIAGPGYDPVNVDYSGTVHLFARLPAGNIGHAWWDGSYSTWRFEDLGGAVTSRPSVTVSGGTLWVVASASDGWTYGKWWNGVTGD